MQYDGEDIRPMTETEHWQRRIRDLETDLKAARADVERARKAHGEASTTAYQLGQENDAMIVTIRVLSKELERWKQ